MNAVSHPPSAQDLESALLLLGFTPGAPARVSPEYRKADAASARGSRCPACGRRGLSYRPFHRRGVYAALAACPGCGHGLEF